MVMKKIIETSVVSRAQPRARGSSVVHCPSAIGKVGKGRVKECFDHRRGTGGGFGVVVLGWRVVVFETNGVGNPRIFGAGLGAEARGSTDG